MRRSRLDAMAIFAVAVALLGATATRATTRAPTATPTLPPDALPDLIVVSTRITIPGYSGGCLTSATVSLGLEICIRNPGTTSGPFNLSVNGEQWRRVDGIGERGLACVFGRYTYPRDTTIILDVDNEIEESDESNNETTRFVPIPSRPPLCTATPMPMATPTPTATRRPCPGDCNGDFQVRVEELITGINIVLDRAEFGSCPYYETAACPICLPIAPFIEAVNAALRGCPR